MAKKKDIKCDMCGKKFDYWDKNQNSILENSFHYGSKYDLGYVKVHLCIDCLFPDYPMKVSFTQPFFRIIPYCCGHLCIHMEIREKLRTHMNILCGKFVSSPNKRVGQR